jgi:hypothetical protein
VHSSFDFIHLAASPLEGHLFKPKHAPTISCRYNQIIREDGLVRSGSQTSNELEPSNQAVCTLAADLRIVCVHAPEQVFDKLRITSFDQRKDNIFLTISLEMLTRVCDQLYVTGGIANHPDLFKTICGPSIHDHRSSIPHLGRLTGLVIDLKDGLLSCQLPHGAHY